MTTSRRLSVFLLLLFPCVLSLAVPLYNRIDPTLGGIPFFIWFQIALAPICTLFMALAYAVTPRGLADKE